MRLLSCVAGLALAARLVVAQAGSSGADVASDAAVIPDAPSAPEAEEVQTSEFQSDAARLLRVVGSALYQDKSAFLRELISNAADALEKYRVLSLTQGIKDAADHPLAVKIQPVKDDGRLIITDSGIGMSRDELQKNLGTIARSGTSEFLQKLSSSQTSVEQASGLIGKFGLGFYSSFLVAKKVLVASKAYDSDTQYVFESSSGGDESQGSSFKIYKDPRGNTLGPRGTEITLYLNDESKNFLDASYLASLIHQHAEFATGDAPIYVWTEEVTKEAQEPDSAETVEEKEVVKKYWKRINDQPPLWMREPKSVSEDEYKGFFKATFKEQSDPLLWSHFKGDAGSTGFRALVYLPSTFEKEFYAKTYQALGSLRLYVRRVFITGDLGETFIPKWLNWLKVIVDADDLPFSVGRDSIQTNVAVTQIKRTVIRKALDMLTSAARDDPEEYNTKIWPVVGTALKLGTLEDQKSQPKLVKLLRFHTSSSSGETTSLDDYLAKRKQGQEQIFYIAGAGMDVADLKKSPFVEKIEARGYEVLYLTEPLDEMITSQVRDYGGLRFQDVAKKGLKYGDEDEEATQADKVATFKPLVEFLQAKLSDAIKEVIVSTRLTTSPCAIVADQMAWTANMERLASAQNKGGQDDFMKQYMKMQKKILEINPDHPLIEGLLDKLSEYGDDNEQAQKDEDLDETVQILYDTSLVRSGFNVRDPHAYFGKVESILRRSLGVSETAQAKVDIKPAPPVEAGPVKQSPSSDLPDEPINFEMPGSKPDGNWADWKDIKNKIKGEDAEEIDLTHDEL